MIHIQQRALGTFQENLFAVVDSIVQEHGNVFNVGVNQFVEFQVFIDDFIHIQGGVTVNFL